MKTAPTIPELKLKMMKDSLRCFILGLLGLLPVIGLPFAIAALWVAGQVRGTEKHYWNVARPYRILGIACAAVGAIVWSGVALLLIYHSINRYVSG